MERTKAKQALATMFLACGWNGSAAEKTAKIDAYWFVLQELSEGEIVYVCSKAMRGEVGNPRFLPTAGELYQFARPTISTVPKKSTEWRPHQDRFLTSSGTLYVTEDGGTTVYSSNELGDYGYALPKHPVVLNRPELESRGVEAMHRLPAGQDSEINDEQIRGLVNGAINSFYPEERYAK